MGPVRCKSKKIGEAYRTARLEILRDDIAPRGVSGFRNALRYRMRSTLYLLGLSSVLKVKLPNEPEVILAR
jgi:hypothetical protein